jgi:hypothetical protein
VLFGYEDGGTLAAMYAAAFPERLSALVLYSALVKGRRSADYPFRSSDEEIDAWITRVDEEWGTDELARWIVKTGAPAQDRDDVFVQSVARWLRSCASPGAVQATETMLREIDARPILSTISAPTLTLQRTGNAYGSMDETRYITGLIPARSWSSCRGTRTRRTWATSTRSSRPWRAAWRACGVRRSSWTDTSHRSSSQTWSGRRHTRRHSAIGHGRSCSCVITRSCAPCSLDTAASRWTLPATAFFRHVRWSSKGGPVRPAGHRSARNHRSSGPRWGPHGGGPNDRRQSRGPGCCDRGSGGSTRSPVGGPRHANGPRPRRRLRACLRGPWRA